MSTLKAALKAAKAALDAHKYGEAIEYVHKVLSTDPGNYHAYVYMSRHIHSVALLTYFGIEEMFSLG